MRELEKATPRVKVFSIGRPRKAARHCWWPSPTKPTSKAGSLSRPQRPPGRSAQDFRAEAEAVDRRRRAHVLGLRQHSLARDRLARDADGAGLPAGGGRFAAGPNIRKTPSCSSRPATEVDGRDREVDVYNYHKANPGKAQPQRWCIGANTSRTITIATAWVWRSS
jgi:hypothetical protein